MPRKPKPTLEEQLALTDDREPSTRKVKNAVRRTPNRENKGFTVQVLPAGLQLISRMARNGASRGSIAHALGISQDKFRDAVREQEEVMEAMTVGLAGLEDELSNIVLEHARGNRGDPKKAFVSAFFMLKARLGWREGDTREDSRPNVQIINLASSQSPEEWANTFQNYRALPKGEPTK